jgi:cobalt-zinc-cadmium resistance protein CzcA
VHATLATVAKNLLEGGLLVIAVLFALLGSLRAGLLVALVIPLSMVFALAGMALLDIPGT